MCRRSTRFASDLPRFASNGSQFLSVARVSSPFVSLTSPHLRDVFFLIILRFRHQSSSSSSSSSRASAPLMAPCFLFHSS